MQIEYSSEDALDAKETLELVYEISELLNCQLDRQTLSIVISLIENGVSPVAIAAVIKELKKEAHLIANERVN